MTNNSGWLSVPQAAILLQQTERWVEKCIENKMYEVMQDKSSFGGGVSGKSYLVSISSLPLSAQIKYLQQGGTIQSTTSDGCDLVGYQHRYGDEGLAELMNRLRMVQAGIAIRKLSREKSVPKLEQLATENNISSRNLYRWMKAYESRGLAGIMRTTRRKDAGQARQMCQAAYNFAYGLYADQTKRKQAVIYDKLLLKQKEKGESACRYCICNPDGDARLTLSAEELPDYPPCRETDKKGMVVPSCRQTLSRILSSIPAEELCRARRGEKAWRDLFMPAATREKSKKVNQTWFGDHHQFDCFVLDKDGKAVRPWMTAWYDDASSCLVGWTLSDNPNTSTIIRAFRDGVMHTKHSPFYGLPTHIYIDNGKDYRSKTFETGCSSEVSLGKINTQIATASVIQIFGVSVTHAIAYRGQSKTVERFFGTLEDRYIRDIPGWCGNKPEERPEDFNHDLKRLIKTGRLLTMDEFYHRLRDEILPAYHNRPHEGQNGLTPLEVYNSKPKARHDQPSANMLAVAQLSITNRTVRTSGIKIKNEWYWDDELIGMAGQNVTIRYDEDDRETVTVIHNGNFLCEAAVKERLQMIGEDPEVLGLHMEKQNRAKKDVQQRIKRASRNVFADEISSEAGNILSLPYEVAAEGRKAKRAEAKQEKHPAAGSDQTRERYLQKGRELLKKA